MKDQFPFAFDFAKMSETFNMPSFDKLFGKDFNAFDFGALQEAQRKNMSALMEANKTAVSGYQALYKRQTELFEAALAEAKDRMSELQGQPMTAETAAQNFETMKTSLEKTLANIKEVAEMAQTANTDAFDIIKARTEEVFAEMKAATDKLAA